MCTVSSQIQRAINEAISDRIMPQIRATLKSGQGHVPERRWENPARRPEYRSKVALDRRFRSDSRDEYYRFANRNQDLESPYGMVTGDNESPIFFRFSYRTTPIATCNKSTSS